MRRIDEVYRQPVRAVIESMTGACLVHDTLEQEGWDVETADAQKVIHKERAGVKGCGYGPRLVDAWSRAATWAGSETLQ